MKNRNISMALRHGNAGRAYDILFNRTPSRRILDKIIVWGSDKGYYHLVKLAIEKGGNVRAWDSKALFMSVLNRNTKITTLLIRNGATMVDVPLAMIINTPYRSIMERLYPLVDEDHIDEGLVYAVKSGNLLAVEFLLEKGADPSYGDNLPMSIAARDGRRKIIISLMNKGATTENIKRVHGRVKDLIECGY